MSYLIGSVVRRFIQRIRGGKSRLDMTFDEALGTRTKNPYRRSRMDSTPVSYIKPPRPKQTPARLAAVREQQRQDAIRLARDIQTGMVVAHG